MNRENEKKYSITLVALACASALLVVFALCSGAAYTAVRQARLSAAAASVGQLEAVLLLAENSAAESGLGSTAGADGQTLLKSYDQSDILSMPDYDKHVLNYMLQYFGNGRSFDFAVSRYQEGTTLRTEIYYFPTKGLTDTKIDRYYLMKDGQVTEKNA